MAIPEVIKKPKSSPPSGRKNKIRSLRLVNLQTGEYVTILPNLGATVRELVLRHNNKLYSLLEAPRSVQGIIENKHYHGAKLAPFPGRIAGAAYQFEGKTYNLRANTADRLSAIHGSIFDKPFRLVKTIVKNRSASVLLDYFHSGKTKGYPFRFSLRVIYTLTDGAFACTTEIRNIDRKPLPIGDSWHPYFKTSGSVKHLRLSLPPHSVVELTPSKIPTGKIGKQVKKRSMIPLKQKHLDSVIDLGEQRRRIATNLLDPRLGLRIELWQDAGKGRYRYLVLYMTPSGSSVAIEPWTCAPNAFNNKMGLIVLKPGRKFKASYGVVLKSLRSV